MHQTMALNKWGYLMLPRQIGLLCVAALAVLLVGCANVSIRLYDANLDKQGAAAKADWEAVKPTATLAAVEANNAALLKAEFAEQDAVAISERNLRLRSFIDTPLHHTLKNSPCDGLQDLVDNLLYLDLLGAGAQPPGPGELCGFAPAAAGANASTSGFAQWRAAQAAFMVDLEKRMHQREDDIRTNVYLTSKLSGFDAYYTMLKLVGVKADCQDVANVSGYSPRLKVALDSATAVVRRRTEHYLDKDMRNLCHDPRVVYLDEKGILATYAMAPGMTLGGAIKEAFEGFKVANKELMDAEKAQSDQEAAFKDASDAYDKAVAAAAPDKDPSVKLKQAAADFQKVVKDLQNASSATGGRFDVFLSKQRLDALASADDSLIKGLAQNTVPAGTSKPVTTIVLLSGFSDEAQQVIANSKEPLALPLQLYRDQQQIIYDQAKIVVSLQQAKVKLAERLLSTVMDEIYALYSANIYLKQASGKLFAGSASGASTPPSATARRTALAKSSGPTATLDGTSFVDLFSVPDKETRLLLENGALSYLDVVGRLEATRRKVYYQQIDAEYAMSLSYSAANVKRWQALITASVDQVAGFAASGIKPDFWATLVQTASLLWIGHGVNK